MSMTEKRSEKIGRTTDDGRTSLLRILTTPRKRKFFVDCKRKKFSLGMLNTKARLYPATVWMLRISSEKDETLVANTREGVSFAKMSNLPRSRLTGTK